MLQKMILVKLFLPKYRRGNRRDDLQWERLDLLFTMFGNALRNGLILNQDVRSFTGRINHYAIMVGGRTKRCLILHLHDESKAPLAEVKVRSQTLDELSNFLPVHREYELELLRMEESKSINRTVSISRCSFWAEV